MTTLKRAKKAVNNSIGNKSADRKPTIKAKKQKKGRKTTL